METTQEQPPVDLISMAADGRLKTVEFYLSLVAAHQKVEEDIASMEAQLKISDRDEKWRDTCLYNLSVARGRKKAIHNSLAEIHALCLEAGQVHPLCSSPTPLQSTEPQK